MKFIKWIIPWMLLAAVVAGCSQPKSLPTPAASATPDTVVPSLIPPAATVTPALPTVAPVMATSTPAAVSPTATTASSADGLTMLNASADQYIDDRSGVQIIASLFNAINRKEYLRAYSYWSQDSGVGKTPFTQYAAGYADTEQVQVQVGSMTVDAGAGNYYTSVPVALTVQASSGAQRFYVGCYVYHQSAPANFGAPPFEPIELRSADVKQVTTSVEFPQQLAAICQNEGSPVTVTPAPAGDDISAGRFLDDRSDGLHLVRSFYNAINRNEWVRAYAYYDDQVGVAYADFEAQYQHITSAAVTFGQITGDAGAGNFYTSVPVIVTLTDDNGTASRQAGCIVTHLSSPSAQATPPFKPLSIRSVKFSPLAADADEASILASVCQP